MHSRTGHQNAARLVTAVSTTVAVLAALTAVAAPAQVAGPAIPGVSTTRSPSTVAGPAPSGSTPATPTATPLAAVWPIPENGQLHRKIGEVRTGPSPKQVAFSPDGTELWVPLLGAVGIDVYRVPTLERIARIPLGTKGGVEVIFTRDGSRAYVSQMHTSSVYEIDRVAKRVIRILTTKGNWTKILELSPDEKTLYAANWISNNISVIDLASGTVTRLIPTVTTPRGLSLSPDGLTMYVAGFEDGNLVRIDIATLKQTELIRTGGAMRHLAFDPSKNTMYADDMGGDVVYAFDLATDKHRVLARTDSHPNTIDLSLDRRFLYVSNRGQNSTNGYYVPGPDWGSVTVIDTTTGATVDAIVGGNQTTGLDISPNGRLLAFTDFLDGRLQLYEIPPAAVLASSDGKRAMTYKAELLKPVKRRKS